jgi:AP endonuclease-1
VRCAPQELERFWLVNAYVPNSGEGLKRLDYRVSEAVGAAAVAPLQSRRCSRAAAAAPLQPRRPAAQPPRRQPRAPAARVQVGDSGWDRAFAGYLQRLQASKPVVLAGDLNCAHAEVDIHRAKGNERSAGFTIVRRRLPGVAGLGWAGWAEVLRCQQHCLAGAAPAR